MKTIIVSLAMILASVSALPSLHVENAIRSGQERLVTDSIASAIEDVSQAIIDAGLDPLIIDNNEMDYALPVPSIFNLRAYLRGLLFQGLSNIVIKQLNFSVLTTRVTYHIEMPQILLNTVASEVDANLFGKNIHSSFSGRIAFNNIETTGNIRVSIGIISGISVRDIALTIKLGGIESQLNLIVQGVNYSNAVNKYMGETIPNTLDAFARDINELLTIVGKDVIETIL